MALPWCLGGRRPRAACRPALKRGDTAIRFARFLLATAPRTTGRCGVRLELVLEPVEFVLNESLNLAPRVPGVIGGCFVS